MAVVWRAWDPVLGREVAIKEPLLPGGADPATAAEYAARFIREGQAAARLSHPGIVGIYAADIYQDRLALVMELVEGETLGQLIGRGPVDPPTALDILEQLLDALAFAHGQGVIHGDIKPDNIFLTSSGQVKLAGFGIPHVGDDPALARAGLVRGTPGYMAPEQISGDPVDTRADLFALGVVAYEMLTGKNPFGASDGLPANAVMYRTLYQAPPEIPQKTLAGLPRDIRPVLDVALAKDPNSRFPDAESFLAALRGTASVSAVAAPGKVPPLPAVSPPRITRSQRRWRLYYSLGGLAVVALVVVVVVLVTQGGHSGLSSETTVASGSSASTGPPSTLLVATTTTAATVASTTTTALPLTTTTAPSTTTTATTPTRYQQGDSRLAYLGSWSASAASEASGGSLAFSNAQGASVTVTFNGTYLSWIAKKSPVYGKAKVTLDRGAPVIVDLYSASTLWQQKVWNTGTLPAGTHTLKIEWTGTKNTAATDTNISVDAFDLLGTLTQAPTPTT